MENYKLCPNGHYYNSSLTDCPYCPKASNNPLGGMADETVIHNPTAQPLTDKTQLFTPPAANDGASNTDKTRIVNPAAQPVANSPKNHRKLVGWLVSYTIDENGVDFKLFEGRNTLGADAGNDIVLANDAAISSKHLTILFRLGTFKYKDELSTNGTFINGQIADEGNLADGDTIKLGETVLRFRQAV